ncbi:MAG TPA: hypothetical protein PK472_02170, partial [Pseudomonadota bacterium]|nr:hypothetical protein [Pseudomonadota bacterium]
MRSSANKDRRKHAASEQSSEAIHELTLPLSVEPEPAPGPAPPTAPARFRLGSPRWIRGRSC